MAEAPSEGAHDSDTVEPAPRHPTEEYGALRALLVEPEQRRLDALEGRLDDPRRRTAEVGRVLPEALSERAHDPRVVAAIEPIVSASLKQGQQGIIDALTPIMGRLIRHWIARELRTRFEELSRLVEQSVSVRALRWRVEALTSERSFAEIVVLRTFVFRVRHVFLIHRETGLRLEHAAAPGAESLDPDMVSSMLSAVGSFVTDSFGVEEADGQGLQTIEVGPYTVWAEEGATSVLAGVLEGVPDPGLRRAFAGAIGEIESEMREELGEFIGDVEPFERIRPVLQGLMQATADRERNRPWLLVAGLIGLLALLAWTGVHTWRTESLWQQTLADLRAEPGVEITEAWRDGSSFHVRGLRDPLATDPAALARGLGVPADAWHAEWTNYRAEHAPFVERRLRAALALPSGVELSFEGGTAHLSGEAEARWIAIARRVATAIDGVNAVDTSSLRARDTRGAQVALLLDPPLGVETRLEGSTLVVTGEGPARWLAGLERRATAIEGIDQVDVRAVDRLMAAAERVGALEIEFGPDVAELTRRGVGQLEAVVGDLVTLRQARPWVRFVVVGHADTTGAPRRNAQLRRARSKVVADRLRREGDLADALREEPDEGQDARSARAVTIRVE